MMPAIPCPPQAQRCRPYGVGFFRVEGHDGERILTVLGLVHGARRTLLPRVIGPVLGRGMPHQVYVRPCGISVAFALRIEENRATVSTQQFQKTALCRWVPRQQTS